ncbi:MAG: zinc ribbon domain-containing protein [Methanobacterium sp.]|jgi:hypothetical protein
MICDNCGAIIDESEEYCPNCGMELLTPKPIKNKYYREPKAIKHKNQSSKPAKKKYYKDYESLGNHSPIETPIKRRYYEDSALISPDYSQYVGEYEYEESDYKEKSGVGTIIIFLFIALVLGLVVGLLMFGPPQTIPQMPGFNV